MYFCAARSVLNFRTVATVRKFRTKQAAQKYMEENAPFFSHVPFSVECVRPKEVVKATLGLATS